MKKRVVSLLLCLIMALSLIPTAAFATEVPGADSAPADEVQVQEAATGEVAVYRGGGDKVVTGATKVDWKQFFGHYSSNTMIKTPDDTRGHCKVYLGNDTTTEWSGYTTQSEIADKGITIVPDTGYYVKQVLIACDDREGYNCQTAKRDAVGKFGSSSTESATYTIDGSKLGLNATVGTNNVWHYGNGTPLHVMIWLGKSPNPATVTYDAGTMSDVLNDALLVNYTTETQPNGVIMTDGYPKANGNTVTYLYDKENSPVQPRHTTLDMIDDYKTVTKDSKTYKFAGWNVEVEMDGGWNTIATKVQKGKELTIYANYKLIAQWEEVVITTGSLTVTKNVTGETSVAPDSFSITVKGPGTGTDAKTYTETVTAGKSVTFENLPFGSYTITEADASATKDGYSWTETISNKTVTIGNENLNPTVTVTNTYTKKATVTDNVSASLTIKKVDSDTTEVLSGATFELRKDTDTLPLTYNAEKGTYEVPINAAGTWSLYETKAPFGYKDVPATGKEVATVIVTAHEFDPAFDADLDKWVITKTYTIDNVSVGTKTLTPDTNGAYQIENDKDFGDDVTISAVITIKKSDENGKPLAGAEFALSFGTTKTLPSKDNGDGTYTISGIDAKGAWTLSETKAPERHQKTDDTWTVNVTKALEVTQDPDTGVYQNVYTYSADSTMIEVTNNRWYADEVINPATLTIYKSDSNVATKMLEGAKFTLTQGTTVLESEDKGDGVYTISGINNIGKWTLTETTAPQGYVLPTEGWTINVSKSLTFKEVEIEDNGVKKYQKVYTYETNQPDGMPIENTAMGTLTISKELVGLNATDFEGGFAFDIKDASGKVVATVKNVFPNAAQPTTVTLAPGKYTIVEKNADVKDYDLTTEYDKETFTVEAGKNVTVTVTNTYTKKVTPPPAEYTLSVDIQKNIELKRSSSRKPGKASFTFEAYLVDEKGNETILDTVTIDTKGTKSADGTLTFTLTEDDLSVTGHGTVYVREVKGSTRGWTYDDTVYALGVELLDGKLNIISVDTKRIDKPATLEFTNVYYKRSGGGGGGDKPIQSVKTGDMGIAMYAMTSLLSLGGAALVIKKRREEK